MSWMTAENETHRVVWRDRMTARDRMGSRTVLRNGVWVTVAPEVAPMVSWRSGSSRVTSEETTTVRTSEVAR